MEESKKQIPNILTVIRIFLAIFCTYFAFQKMWTLSLIFFMVAGFTDFLDGYLARKWKTESNFGRILDPIADKVLILGVLFSFSMKEVVPFLFTGIIAFREILLTVIRLILAPKKVIIAAVPSGKFKTFFQGGSLLTIYLILIFFKQLQAYVTEGTLKTIIYFLLLFVVLVTLYSGIDFFIRNKRAIKKLM